MASEFLGRGLWKLAASGKDTQPGEPGISDSKAVRPDSVMRSQGRESRPQHRAEGPGGSSSVTAGLLRVNAQTKMNHWNRM